MGKTIYSNFDHVLDKMVEKELAEGSIPFADHVAYNFFSTITKDGGWFVATIMQNRYVIDVVKFPSVMEAIIYANEKYGDG